jgi:NAD-dependent SIR2 family protein deacetylase
MRPSCVLRSSLVETRTAGGSPTSNLRQIKPDLVFFGESILPEVRARSCVEYEYGRGALLSLFHRFRHIDECGRFLVIGTTLATYSAFR